MIETIELTEEEKDRAAARNGWAEDRRDDKIKEGISKTEYDKDKENAISRKTQKEMIELFKEMWFKVFGEELQSSQFDAFLAYDEDIEKIITKVDRSNV